MDISKYLTNKDIQLSNEDINFEKLEKDIRKGYVSSDEVSKAVDEAKKESTAKYVELEEKYNKLEKTFNDTEARNVELTNNEKELRLEVEMVSQGFKKENLKEISALRSSLFKDEEDDAKAISSIKEKYKATYFPESIENAKTDIPDEGKFNQTPAEIKKPDVTRKTSIKDIRLK